MTTDDDSDDSANPNNTDDAATVTSEDERVLRHVMTLIHDDDKGTVHEILTHAGASSALDTLAFDEETLSKMKAKVAGKAQTPIPFYITNVVVVIIPEIPPLHGMIVLW